MMLLRKLSRQPVRDQPPFDCLNLICAEIIVQAGKENHELLESCVLELMLFFIFCILKKKKSIYMIIKKKVQSI